MHTEGMGSSKVEENIEHSSNKPLGSTQSRPFIPIFIQEDEPTQEVPMEDNEDAEILAKYQALGADFQSTISYKDYLEVTK